ncbi:SHD1 domain-containing protein [bacterium]|nr:SHD1 domain-containing protein [bacterium]
MNTILRLKFVVLSLFLTCSVSETFAQGQPVQPTPEMPSYQLSNIRNETDRFARSVIAFDWKRRKKGTGYASVSGKTKSGPLSIISGPSLNGDSGTASFQNIGFGFGTSGDIEFWISVGGPGGVKYMVSNSVRLGNPGPATSARAMNAKERAAVEQAKLAATPPSGLPNGYVAVESGTSLVSGMPVKGGWMAGWEDAEVISLHDNGSVALRYPDHGESLVVRTRKDWIAVQPSVLEQAKANPDRFQPSLKVLPNSRLIVPKDAVVIPADLELPKGTPVLVDYRIKWHEAYVVDDSGDEIEIRYEGYGANWDKKYPRSGSLIRSKVLANLDDPAIVQKYAKNLNGTTSRRNLKDYPIRGEIPRDSELVPDELEVPDGAKLGAYWGSRWYKMTLLGSNDDGTLNVHWDDYGDAWDCDMKREQLIIAKSEVRKLTQLMKSKPQDSVAKGDAPTSENGSDEVRTWQDATGKFTIKAKFVSSKEGVVHLEMTNGKTVEIGLDKLSKADQEVATKLQKEAAENPFIKN